MSPKNDEVCVDEVADKTTTESSISLIQISESIAKLKAADGANFPKEPLTPEFNDKSSRVDLRILPKNLALLKVTNFGIINLPHPLSKNRRVCYIGTDVESEEKQSEVTKKIRDQGIVGKIKIVPVSLIEMALKDRNKSALVELAKLYDTYLVDVRCEFVEASLRDMLTKYKKFILTVSENFEISWGATAIWNFFLWKDLSVRVGDFGLTDQQLQENIAHVIDSLRHNKFLPNSLDDVKLITVSTGNTDGVTIYRENSEEEVHPLLPAQVITDGMAKLKVMYNWPKEPVASVFSDGFETLHLRFGLKNESGIKKKFIGTVTLPHPLSKNRRVCYIGTDLESEEKQAEATKEIRDQGAEGKIKIIPVSLIQKVLNDRDHSPLQELATLYDTILVDPRFEGIGQRLQDFLTAEKKFVLKVKKDCDISWGASALWYGQKNCILVKVGDVGLTDQQLLENVAHVLTSFRSFRLFQNGLDDITYINLACGLEEGIPIYQDNATKFFPGLPAEVIADGIAKLKADYPNWPKEAKYNDDASTVILSFEIDNTVHSHFLFRGINLPHPLSLDRSVCYIISEEPTAERQAEITQTLRDAGVLGTITILAKRVVDLAITNNDNEAVTKLATLFDTYLVEENVNTKGWKLWSYLMLKEHKQFVKLPGPSSSLRSTKAWLNSIRTAGYIKVGYTGLTDEQLQENIEHIVYLLLQMTHICDRGHHGLKSVRLMTGTTNGVIIYKNDSIEVVSKPEIPVQMEESNGVELSDATPISENVPLPKKNGKRKKFTPTPSNNGVNGKDTSPISAKNGDKVTVPETTPQAVTLSAKNAANGKKNTPISAKNGDKVEKTTSVASSMIVPETAPQAEPLSAKKKGAKRKLAATHIEAKKLKANGKRKKFTPTPSNNGVNGKETTHISVKDGDKVTVPETTPQAVTLSAKKAANGKNGDKVEKTASVASSMIVPETAPQAEPLSAKKKGAKRKLAAARKEAKKLKAN